MYNLPALENPLIPMDMRVSTSNAALSVVDTIIANGIGSYEATDAYNRMIAYCSEIIEYCDKNGIRKG